MELVAGPSSLEIAYKISNILKAGLIEVEQKFFPDSESYIRIKKSVKNEDVVIIQGMHPPQDTHIIQTFLLIDTLLDLGASSVELVSPYLAYTRQDKRFLDGEAVSFKTLLKILHKLGLKKTYTVNIHCPWIIQESPTPIIDLRGEKPLAAHIKEHRFSKPVVISVGKKGLDMAKMVAEQLGVEYASAQSERDRVTGQVKVELDGLPGIEAIVVDDIISTGGTMVELIKLLKRRGFKKIYATCIHALLVGNAVERIFNAGADRIIASDTVPNRFAEYTVAGIISEELKKKYG
ncbi:MAG: ribose-phosphate diphosphokinase [Nitrososphaerota archaeon]